MSAITAGSPMTRQPSGPSRPLWSVLPALSDPESCAHRADVPGRAALASAGGTEQSEARSRRHASMGPS